VINDDDRSNFVSDEMQQVMQPALLYLLAVVSLVIASCGGGRGPQAAQYPESADQYAETAASEGIEDQDAGNTVSNEESVPATHDDGDRLSSYLKASDQRGDGTSVVVDEAIFTGTEGWVVIHAAGRVGFGKVIGVSELLPAGTHTNIDVPLNEPLQSSGRVFPMLHLEDNNNGTYDFPNGDAPALSSNGIVVFPIRVEVE
jgi:hypothetical protein